MRRTCPGHPQRYGTGDSDFVHRSAIETSGEAFRGRRNQTDTLRIQDALDHCAGHAVDLKSAGEAHAFLSGPLQLRAGVTLLVDGGAILLASRNPRAYDVSPGSCGVVNKVGRGCKALITGDHVNHAGVMGDGWIDGRGPSTLNLPSE